MIALLAQARIVPIVVIDDPAQAIPLADALLLGGMTTVEVTLRTENALPAIRNIVENRPGLTVLAGTVLSISEADACLDAGVTGIISPGFDPDLSSWCQERGLPLTPGVATATEILTAAKAGHRLLKFFPAKAAGGMQALSALHSPFAKLRLKFMPTGGLGPDDMPQVLSQPFVAAMGGTWIAPTADISSGNWKAIAARAAEALAIAATTKETAS